MSQTRMAELILENQATLLALGALLAVVACVGVGLLIWMHLQTRAANVATVAEVKSIMAALIASTDRTAASMEGVGLLLADWLRRPVKESTQRAVYKFLRESGRFVTVEDREALVAFLSPTITAQIRVSEQPDAHLRSIVYVTAAIGGQASFATLLQNAMSVLNGSELGIRFRKLCVDEGFPIP